jgi:hypothetical protein
MDPAERQKARQRSLVGLMAGGLILLLLGATVLLVTSEWEFFKTATPSQTELGDKLGVVGDE